MQTQSGSSSVEIEHQPSKMECYDTYYAGQNVFFFAAFYFARFELLTCLQARACEGGNNGSYSMRKTIDDAKKET